MDRLQQQEGMTLRQVGFTLVEMAMVLAIIGLIMGAVLTLAAAQIQSSRLSSTQAKEDTIKKALQNFLVHSGRLPCPAVPTLAALSPGYGVEAATPGACTLVPSSGSGASAVVTGIVPWVTLGLTDDAAQDGYYNRFTYQVTLSATNTVSPAAVTTSGQQTVAGLKGAIAVHSGTPAILGLPPIGNQINDCMPSGGTYNPCLAVVVIVSHGANGYGAYTSNGTQVALPPAGTDEYENANGDSTFVMKDFSTSATNPFDDVILPLTANDLLSPLAATGSIKDANSLLNAEFSNITAAITAYAVANRYGSPGSYSYLLPGSLAPLSLPATTAYDPWGNPIQYVRGTASVSSTTSSSGVAYTLTSYGPDGAAGGGDDVVVTVYVNQLQPAFSSAGW
jgi:prepilin-type N-terminal cleavage/methylation domain-containing protein